MSAEHFQTFLSCDMRTAPNGRTVEYAESLTQEPRAFVQGPDGALAFNPEVTERGRAWSSCYLYAHNALEICARTVEDSPMDGLTGDHEEKRRKLAAIIRAAAFATRELALDAAHDGALTDDDWAQALERVRLQASL